MDTTEHFRLRIFAAESPGTNRILALLRQANISLAASPYPGTDAAASELKDPAFNGLLILDEGSMPTSSILQLMEVCQFPLPILVARIPQEETLVPPPGLDCQQLSWEDDARIIATVRQTATLQQALSRNQALEFQLREMSRSQEMLLGENVPAIVLVREGRLLHANPVFASLFDCKDPSILPGKPLADFFLPAEKDRLDECLNLARPTGENLELVSADIHGKLPVVLRFTTSVFQDKPCLQVQLTPAPANAGYARQKALMHHQDLVTRLDNLPYFQMRLESAIGKALNHQACSLLLVVRFDRFARLQESMGKAGVGRLLADISGFLYGEIKRPFTACRLSDDEFAILLYDTPLTSGSSLVDYISAQINDALARASQHSFSASASIGVATINEFSLDSEAMICRARSNAAIDTKTLRGIPVLSTQIRTALKAKNFRLLFQPIIGMHDNGRHRYEVLVRMVDEEGTLRTPADFMPTANLDNLAEAIDKVVLSQLFSRPRRFAAEQPVFFIHVSSNTLANLTLLPWLSQRLQKNRFLSDKLIIQISELDYLHNTHQVQAFADCLAKLDLPLALTAFGNAMDPLGVIEKLRPVLVRLDHTLIRDLLYSKEQQRKVRQLIQAIHAQQVQVAVTRIDDIELLPLLWDLAVDYVEGYCLQAPDTQTDFPFPHDEVVDLK